MDTLPTTRDRLILAALAEHGATPEPPALASLAAWIDYQNHDGTTADELARDLERLAAAGWLRRVDGRYALAHPLPPDPHRRRR